MESYALFAQRGVRLRSEPSGLNPRHACGAAGHSPPPHVLFAAHGPVKSKGGYACVYKGALLVPHHCG